jgi:hypothetical protein
MEALLAFGLIGCFTIVAIVVGFGGVGFLIYWSIKRSKWQRDRLAKVGTKHGLAPQGRRCVAGSRGGVHCSIRQVTEGSGDNSSSWTYVEAEIDPPLRLGLNLRKKGWLGQAFSELLGARDVTVGDAHFDASFNLNAIERDEVARLFDENLRAALMRAHGALRRMWMTDDRVHASFGGWSVDEVRILAYLDAVTHLANEAKRARRSMGPTTRERSVLANWGGLAQVSEYRFDEESLTLEGERGRHRFAVVPVLGPSGWSTRFRVSFGRPLGVALQLRKEHALASVGRLFGFSDIEVGDPRFDDVFSIRGTDPDAIRAIFSDPALRERLLALFAGAKSLEVQDELIDAVAMGLVSNSADLARSLDRVVEVAEGLRSSVEAPRVGAYR